MILSHQDLVGLAEELTTARGAVQSLWVVAPGTWVFQTRGPGETHYFVVSCDLNWARLHLVERKAKDALPADALTMLMRKWLLPSFFLGASVFENDRIVDLSFEHDGETLHLYLETSLRWSNLALVLNGKVLGSHRTNERVRIHHEWTAPEGDWANGKGVLDAVPVGERSAHIAKLVAQGQKQEFQESEAKEVNALLKNARKKLQRREKAISKDLVRIDESEHLRRQGELLNTMHGRVTAGASSVTVTDYWEDGMPEVEVELDPSRSLQANIDRAFHEYRRMKNAKTKVEARLLATMEEMELLDRLALAYEAGTRDLESLRAELRKLRLTTRPQTKAGAQPAPRIPYREFKSSRGTTILVGRNAKDNDALTLRHARGRDIWLHARDVTGSHVVLRQDKGAEVDGQDLLEAAMLAAWFSKNKNDSVIDVMWTHNKHVRKPKGAAPGSVSVAGAANIAIQLDQARVEALLANEVQEN